MCYVLVVKDRGILYGRGMVGTVLICKGGRDNIITWLDGMTSVSQHGKEAAFGYKTQGMLATI